MRKGIEIIPNRQNKSEIHSNSRTEASSPYLCRSQNFLLGRLFVEDVSLCISAVQNTSIQQHVRKQNIILSAWIPITQCCTKYIHPTTRQKTEHYTLCLSSYYTEQSQTQPVMSAPNGCHTGISNSLFFLFTPTPPPTPHTHLQAHAYIMYVCVCVNMWHARNTLLWFCIIFEVICTYFIILVCSPLFLTYCSVEMPAIITITHILLRQKRIS